MKFDGILFALYSLNFFINAANSVLAPFYPSEATSKGVSTTIVGIVFSAHPICSFFFSLILGKMMKFWGRKKILGISLLMQAIGLVLFGTVIYIDNYAGFITASVIARGIQGIGLGSYGSIAYAYLPLLYPDNVEKTIALMELLTGLGLMLGPLMGGVLYELGGYQCPFYVMSAIFIISAPFILRKLPPDTNFLEGAGKKESIHLTKYFKNRKILFLYILMMLPNCGISFLEPTLANHLSQFTSSSFVIAVLFSVGTLTYALTIPLINMLKKDYNKKMALIAGTLICTVGYLFLGPYQGFGLPENIGLVILGLCIVGVGAALSLVPSIPEFINIGSEIYPEDKEGVGDMASGLFNSSYSAGILVGPLIGGALDEKIGFPNAEALFALVNLGILAIYLIFGDGYQGFLIFSKEKKEALLDGENKGFLKETTVPIETVIEPNVGEGNLGDL